MNPSTDRFSQPLWNEGQDWEREEKIELEKAEQKEDLKKEEE